MEVSGENHGIELSSSVTPKNSFDMHLQRRCPPSAGSRAYTAISSSSNNCLAQELFNEACSALYNDILDAVDHRTELTESDISCRQMEIFKQGAELSEAVPELSNLIASKLSTVSRAMEHLKLNRRSSLETTENGAKEEGEPTALSELRKWVQTMDEKLSTVEAKFTKIPLARKELDRLAADQQIIQLQIEAEGQTLVRNVQRTITRYSDEGDTATECLLPRRERHLKALTQRWYHLWIRSLSVQCRIDRQLEQLHFSDDESESDPELREPQLKRRRFSDTEIKFPEAEDDSDGHLKSNEDTIPFSEEEYESIDGSIMSKTEEDRVWREENGRVQEMDASKFSTTGTSYCEGNHQDINNSMTNNTSNCAHETVSNMTGKMAKDTEEVDEQRRQRIQCSPVKSFYKTVPLDETGATDTETPRVSMSSGWPAGSLYTTDVHGLSDSLIVNAEDEPEMDSSGDFKEILSMLDDVDDENGNPKWEGQGGTQWHEFKCGNTRYQLPFSRSWFLGSAANNDEHSCDASSEESDELPTDLNAATITKAFVPSPVLDCRPGSLKRRRKWRFSTSERLPLINAALMKTSNSSTVGHDMEASMCSQTCSDGTHLDGATVSLNSIRLPSLYGPWIGLRNKHHVRRKLRARRLPRSMSDGEQLGMWMNTSIHSAPGTSLWRWSGHRDSDVPGPEQSDVPPYEWDDYNPPAKTEDEWDGDEDQQEDISVMAIEDDFQIQLGEPRAYLYPPNHPPYYSDENETVVKERAPRPVATVTGKYAPKYSRDSASSGEWKVELLAMKRTSSLAKSMSSTSRTFNSSGLRHFSESDLTGGRRMTDNATTNSSSNTSSSTECSHSFRASCQSSAQRSALPTILSKMQKFASSLKLIQHDDSAYDSSLSTMSSIRSLGDVMNTLKIFNDIHERLLEEQEELQSLLSSDSFSGNMSGLRDEFQPLCQGYEAAVERVEQVMAQVEAIRDKWSDWAETQRIMQATMRTIESDLSELRKGADNSQQICSELELCQERMNRLETVCNYLSCNLASLHHRSSTQPPIDFASELALYSNALIQLKTRFEKEMNHMKSADKATFVRSRKRMHLNDGMKKMLLVEQGTCMDGTSVKSPKTKNWSLKALFIFAIMAAFTAWFATSSQVSWRTTLGPHLDYVNGPPPV